MFHRNFLSYELSWFERNGGHLTPWLRSPSTSVKRNRLPFKVRCGLRLSRPLHNSKRSSEIAILKKIPLNKKNGFSLGQGFWSFSSSPLLRRKFAQYGELSNYAAVSYHRRQIFQFSDSRHFSQHMGMWKVGAIPPIFWEMTLAFQPLIPIIWALYFETICVGDLCTSPSADPKDPCDLTVE